MSRIVEIAKERKDIIMGDDGFYVYWPEGNKGALTSHDLRELADELDRMNCKWEEIINEYFEDEDKK